VAEHIWSILSEKTVIDSGSNLLSIFDVLEQVNLSGAGPQEYKKGDSFLIPIRFSLASLWVRSDSEKPEKVKTRINIVAPDKKTLASQEIEIDLTKKRRGRGILNSKNLFFNGPGIYQFKVDIEKKKGKGKSWKNVASVPLEVIFDLPPSKPKSKKRVKRKTL